MRCRYCREEIQDKASKCKECGELLGFRRRLRSLSGLCRGFVAVLVPVASLGLAFVEHQAKERAVEKKEDAQIAEAEAVREKDDARMGEEAAQTALATLVQERPYEEILSVAGRDLPRLSRAVLRDEESRKTAKDIRELKSESIAAAPKNRLEAERLRREARELQEKITPPEALPARDLGSFYLQVGEPEKAAERFEKALEKNPRDIEARKGLVYSRALAETKGR